jgi:hypothetical protein
MVERTYDVFLSYCSDDAACVENLAQLLVDRFGFKVWLDRWALVPGESWQQGISRGLAETKTCAVCVGGSIPDGWFQNEIERALNLQARGNDRRIIPVLLPNAPSDAQLAELLPNFLELRHCIDLRSGLDDWTALHRLRHGINGTSPGPWSDSKSHHSIKSEELLFEVARELEAFEMIRPYLCEPIIIETQRRIVAKRFK